MTRLFKRTSLVLLAAVTLLCVGLALAFSVKTVSAATDTVAAQGEFYMEAGAQVRLSSLSDETQVDGIRFKATISEEYADTLKADAADGNLTYYVIIGLASKVPDGDISGLTIENSQTIKQVVLVSPKEDEDFTDGKYTFSGSLNYSEISEELQRTAYDSDFVARAVVTYKDRTAGTKTIYSYQTSLEDASISMSEVAGKWIMSQAEEGETESLNRVAHYIETATEVSAFTEAGSDEIKFIDNPGFERATVYEYTSDEYGEGAVTTLGTIRGASFTCDGAGKMKVDDVKNILILDKDGNFYKAECKKVTKIIEDREDFLEIFAKPQFYFYGTMHYVKYAEDGSTIAEQHDVEFDTRVAADENLTWYKEGTTYYRSMDLTAEGKQYEGYTKLLDTYYVGRHAITGSYVLANDIELEAAVTTQTIDDVKYVKTIVPDLYVYCYNFTPQFWNGTKYQGANCYAADQNADTIYFDGLGHTVSNVDRVKQTFTLNTDGTIKTATLGGDVGGLFNSLDGSTIKNLAVIRNNTDYTYRLGSTLVLGEDGKITYTENAEGDLVSYSGVMQTVLAKNVNATTIDNVYCESTGEWNFTGSSFIAAAWSNSHITNVVINAGTSSKKLTNGYGTLNVNSNSTSYSYDNVIVISTYKPLGYYKENVALADNDADAEVSVGGTSLTKQYIYNGVTRYDGVEALKSAAAEDADLYAKFSDLVWNKLEDNSIEWSALEAATAIVSCGTDVKLTAKTGDADVDAIITNSVVAKITTAKGEKAIVSAISDDESIATVNLDGTIEAVGVGTTFVTLGYRIGGKTYGVTIDVLAEQYNKDVEINYSCYDGLTAEDKELFNGNIVSVYDYDTSSGEKGDAITYEGGKFGINNVSGDVSTTFLYITTDATEGVNEYVLTLNAYTRILYDVEDFCEFFGAISQKDFYDNTRLVEVKTAADSEETKEVMVLPSQIITGCYALGDDIDMQGAEFVWNVSFNSAYDQGENGDGRFTAAGFSGTYTWNSAYRYFVDATFDGLGHTVSNFNIDTSTSSGLFGRTASTGTSYDAPNNVKYGIKIENGLNTVWHYTDANGTAATTAPACDANEYAVPHTTLVKNIAFTNVTYTGKGNRVLLASATGYHSGFENVYVQITGNVETRFGALTFSSNTGIYKNIVVEFPEGPDIVAGSDTMYGYGPMVVDGGSAVFFVHSDADGYSMKLRSYMENVVFITKTPTLGGYYYGNRVYIAQNETLINGEPATDITVGSGYVANFTNAGYTYAGSNAVVASMANKLYIRGTYRYDDYAAAIAGGKTTIGSMTITEDGVVWNYAE